VAATISPDHVALGRAIRELRERRREPLSQEALAAEAGVHRNYLGGVERGERNIAYANLLKIAAALGIRASELVKLAEEKRHRHARS
jgi:transcriptional regulator with XRE-family HTH domain